MLLVTTSPLGGFDYWSHIHYLRVAATGQIPSPADFWQAYQPPGYYLFSALLAHFGGFDLVKTGQFVSLFSSAVVGLFGYLLARRLVPGWELYVAALLLALPSSLETAPMIYGQQLATALIGAFLFVLTICWSRPPILGWELIMALLWGMAIQVRFDGLMLGLPVVILAWKRIRSGQTSVQKLHAALAALVVLVIGLAAASPVFWRNLEGYNTLVLTNRHPLILPYEVKDTLNFPGFFSWTALFNPGPELWTDPRGSHVESLPAFFHQQLWAARFVYPIPVQFKLFAGLWIWGLFWAGAKDWRGNQSWQPVVAVAGANALLFGTFLLGQPDVTNYKAAYLHAAYYLLALTVAAGARRVQQAVGVGWATTLAFLPILLVLIGLGS